MSFDDFLDSLNGPQILHTNLSVTEVRFYYMHGNHTFTRLKGNTLDEILVHADKVVTVDPGGMLCQPILMHKDIEVRRIGVNIHHLSYEPEGWEQEKIRWREAAEKDHDLIYFMQTGGSWARWNTFHSLDALLYLLHELSDEELEIEVIRRNGLPIGTAGAPVDLLRSQIICWAAHQKLMRTPRTISWPIKQKEQ